MRPYFAYHTLRDGTLRMLNPVVGDEVWTVPGRAARPISNERLRSFKPFDPADPLDAACHFCPANMRHTPAEKARVVRDGAGFRMLQKQTPEKVLDQPALFRRVPNLFEIVPWDFWQKNHGLELTPLQARWRDQYLESPLGREHVLGVISEKLLAAGQGADEISALSEQEKLRLADAFFGGTHDLIVSGRHYTEDAKDEGDLLSSGRLDAEAHAVFVSFTLRAVCDQLHENPHAKHVAVYQNWLAPAGASFDHLHKQVLGLDAEGGGMARRFELLRRYPAYFDHVLLGLLKKQGLLLAENAHAIAVVEPGHIYPAVAVYSKSRRSDPRELGGVELEGFSQLLWALHGAMGPAIPCNEEWYFRPRAWKLPFPFHVMIKWRVNTPAGFEGSSQIHVNPLFPEQVRDRLLPALQEKRSQGQLLGVQLGEECSCEEGCLGYHRGPDA